VATVGVLLAEAVGNNGPPSISASVDAISAVHGGYLARVTITNHGAETAADVVLEGELVHGGRVLESSTVTLDYLPGEAERQAGFFFSRDPATAVLRIRPVAYRGP
jgi:uncharacterized protein (TIGR02588 family)